MAEITRRLSGWSSVDRDKVNREITRLFNIQDKNLPDEKRLIYLSELENSKLDPNHICQAMVLLGQQDLRQIKIVHILEQTKEITPNKAWLKSGCGLCHEGTIEAFADGPMYPHKTNIACTCTTGQKKSEQYGIFKWDGSEAQKNGNFNLTIAAQGGGQGDSGL